MPFLFCCGGGGSRQVKTRQDFAAAHSGWFVSALPGKCDVNYNIKELVALELYYGVIRYDNSTKSTGMAGIGSSTKTFR